MVGDGGADDGDEVDEVAEESGGGGVACSLSPVVQGDGEAGRGGEVWQAISCRS